MLQIGSSAAPEEKVPCTRSVRMSGINRQSYFFSCRWRRAKLLTSWTRLRQGARHPLLSWPAAWPQRALPTRLRRGTATLGGEKGRSWHPCKAIQLLSGPTCCSKHWGEAPGRCGPSATVEALKLPWVVLQEGLKQPWCGWRDGSRGTWFGTQDPWVGCCWLLNP